MSRLPTGRRHSSKISFPYTGPDGFQNENVGMGGGVTLKQREGGKIMINKYIFF